MAWEQSVINYIEAEGGFFVEPEDVYTNLFLTKMSWDEFNHLINEMVDRGLLRTANKSYGFNSNKVYQVLELVK